MKQVLISQFLSIPVLTSIPLIYTMTITIKKVRKATSLQEDNLRMNVEINHPNYGWIPYTLDPADTDTTINNDEVMALIGADFAAYVAPTQAELDAALNGL